jgi:hypothetical protein
MGILKEEDKKELLEDALSPIRREEFKKLSKLRYKGFDLKFLEEITNVLQIKYPRHLIKAQKNRL